MLLRKIILMLGMIILLSSCSSEKDEADIMAVIMFKYDTYGNYIGDAFGTFYPVRFFHTNPICTGMPEQMVYYKTEAGQYYLEYVLRDNISYYIIYTIELWDDRSSIGPTEVMINGEKKIVEGKIRKFEINLSFSDSKPDWNDPYYSDDVEIEPIIGKIPSRSVIPPGRNVGPLFRRIKQEQEGGCMTVEYGVLYEGE